MTTFEADNWKYVKISDGESLSLITRFLEWAYIKRIHGRGIVMSGPEKTFEAFYNYEDWDKVNAWLLANGAKLA